jgi:hypothetical protein
MARLQTLVREHPTYVVSRALAPHVEQYARDLRLLAAVAPRGAVEMLRGLMGQEAVPTPPAVEPGTAEQLLERARVLAGRARESFAEVQRQLTRIATLPLRGATEAARAADAGRREAVRLVLTQAQTDLGDAFAAAPGLVTAGGIGLLIVLGLGAWLLSRRV